MKWTTDLLSGQQKEVRGLSIAGCFSLLLASAEKEIELRTWTTDYRGITLFHCSATKSLDWTYDYYFVEPEECPKKSIVGSGELIEVIQFDTEEKWNELMPQHLNEDTYEEMLDSNNGKPVYGHRYANTWLFKEPIEGVPGALNYWAPLKSEQIKAFEQSVKNILDFLINSNYQL